MFYIGPFWTSCSDFDFEMIHRIHFHVLNSCEFPKRNRTGFRPHNFCVYYIKKNHKWLTNSGSSKHQTSHDLIPHTIDLFKPLKNVSCQTISSSPNHGGGRRFPPKKCQQKIRPKCLLRRKLPMPVTAHPSTSLVKEVEVSSTPKKNNIYTPKN